MSNWVNLVVEEIAVAKEEEEVLDGLNNNRHKCMECFHMDIEQHKALILKCLQKNDGMAVVCIYFIQNLA